VYGLRPPALDQFGLTGALRQHAAALSGDELRCEIRGPDPPPPLPAAAEAAAFRIAQEALTNVARHAAGATATVRVSYGPRDLVVQIDDDGGGSTTQGTVGTGKGIVGMRERVDALGGELEAGRRPGGGFRVRARFPLDGASDGQP
jgi:signal transduction histidine kinase